MLYELPQPQSYPVAQTSEVQAQWLQGLVAVMGAVAMAAWAFSQVRKAFKGEEVEKPF